VRRTAPAFGRLGFEKHGPFADQGEPPGFAAQEDPQVMHQRERSEDQRPGSQVEGPGSGHQDVNDQDRNEPVPTRRPIELDIAAMQVDVDAGR